MFLVTKTKKGNQIVLEKPCANPKKLTMTRLGSILGINAWSSDFEVWCEMNRVWSDTFTENESTKAGNVIEPIVREYLKTKVYESDNIVSPEEYYGNLYDKLMIKKDFFQDNKIFGGMWDTARVKQGDKDVFLEILEQKTTKRSEDWVDGVPLYYLVQGLGYAHMLGVNYLSMVVTVLDDKHLRHPERFKPNAKNTAQYDFIVDETKITLPSGEKVTIAECFDIAEQWYQKHVVKGVSPLFDPNTERNKHILDETFTLTYYDRDNAIEDSSTEYKELAKKIAIIEEKNDLPKMKKRLESLKTEIITKLISQSKGDTTKIVYDDFTLSLGTTNSVDSERLKEDGIYEQYVKSSVRKTLTLKKNKN